MEFLNLAALTLILPRLLAAVAILVIGWIVAAVLSSLVGGVLKRTTLDNRIARAMGGDRPGASPLKVESLIAKAVYYLILVFVIIATLEALGLAAVAGPLDSFLSQVLGFIPRLIGAGVLILVAWVVATVLRTIVARVLASTKLDQRVRDASDSAPAAGDRLEQTARSGSGNTGAAAASAATAPVAQTGAAVQERTGKPLSETLSEVVYWLVWLLFLPGILGALGLAGILAPVQTMLDRALAFLPNLIAAGVMLMVGWFVARLLQRIVSGLLAGVGVDALADRVGLGGALGNQRLSTLLGMVVYILVFLPIVVAALNALQLDAVTRPVSNMLDTILASIPNIFGAVLVLAVSFVVGRLVAGLVTGLLASAGFDSLPARLGLSRSPAAAQAAGAATGVMEATGQRPSAVAGNLVLVAVMLFAAIEASRFLGFTLLADLLAQFLEFGGHILAGLAVFAVALYLSRMAADLVRSSGVQQSGMLALAARVSVLVLGGAMALRQMGLANEIVNLAFGLLLGAIALATGLAFGLGGRDVAGEEVRGWRDAVKDGPPPMPSAANAVAGGGVPPAPTI